MERGKRKAGKRFGFLLCISPHAAAVRLRLIPHESACWPANLSPFSLSNMSIMQRLSQLTYTQKQKNVVLQVRLS